MKAIIHNTPAQGQVVATPSTTGHVLLLLEVLIENLSRNQYKRQSALCRVALDLAAGNVVIRPVTGARHKELKRCG
jgi:hypothetical protein